MGVNSSGNCSAAVDNSFVGGREYTHWLIGHIFISSAAAPLIYLRVLLCKTSSGIQATLQAMNVPMKIRTEAHKDHEELHHDGLYASTHSHKQNPPEELQPRHGEVTARRRSFPFRN
jgi:hypothetical protein